MRRSKLWIGAAFILAGLMLMRFAWAIIEDSISPFIMVVAAVLFMGGIIYFAKNFRE
ncbi:MAG: hypothetical protein ACO1N7_00445 [Sphingobacteriaceae bacterium]